MITSVFNKSRPINYIIVFFMLVLAFVLAVFKYQYDDFQKLTFLELGFNFTLVILSLFTITFIIKKNTLTQDNNFTSFCFALFVLLVPQVFLDTKILLSNLFVLLAFRRLVSLSSNRNTVKKIFDSGVFIAFATLLFSWSIGFILLAIIAVLYHQERKGRYLLIPFMGAASVAIICWSVCLYYDDFVYLNFELSLSIFNVYNSFQLISAITLIIVLGLWTTFFFLNSINKRKRVLWPAYKLVVLFLAISSVVFLTSMKKTGSELLFFVSPFSIICANYFQDKNDKWFKEVILFCWITLVLLTVVF